MKKIVLSLLICMLVFTMLLPTAFAAGASIPDFADCAPGLVTFDSEYSPNLRIYLSDNEDDLFEALGIYFTILQSDCNLGGMDFDEESSDTFCYVYLTEYYGSADISPEYMDDCPVPCYVCMAFAPKSDGSVLVVVMCAEGMNFGAFVPSYDDAPVQAVYSNGTVIADIATFTGESFYCDEIDLSNSVDDADWYSFQPNSYDIDLYTLGQDYVQALVDSGYYELMDEGNTMEWYNWHLKYTGRADLPEMDDPMVDYDLCISIRQPDVFAYYKNPGITFVEEREEQDGPSYPGTDTSSSSSGGSSGHWEYREVEVDCPSCTFGNCSVCGGDGVYERYGEKVSCDPDCSSCDGEGKITRTESVWVTG